MVPNFALTKFVIFLSLLLPHHLLLRLIPPLPLLLILILTQLHLFTPDLSPTHFFFLNWQDIGKVSRSPYCGSKLNPGISITDKVEMKPLLNLNTVATAISYLDSTANGRNHILVVGDIDGNIQKVTPLYLYFYCFCLSPLYCNNKTIQMTAWSEHPPQTR